MSVKEALVAKQSPRRSDKAPSSRQQSHHVNDDEAAIQRRELGGKAPAATLYRQDTPVIVVDVEADNGVEVVEKA